MDVTIKNKLYFYLDSKSIWFMGSSIVYWGEKKALSRAGSRHLGLQNRGSIYVGLVSSVKSVQAPLPSSNVWVANNEMVFIYHKIIDS
jgi:hypothetical protein